MVVVFLRLVMPVTLIGSAFIFEKFLASDYQTSLLALDQTGAALKKLNGGAAPTEAPAPASAASKPAAAPEKKGFFSGALEALSSAKDAVVLSADQAQAKFDSIQAMAERTAERMVTLIVVFLAQTIVVPSILLFVLYRLLGGLVLHNRPLAGTQAPLR